MPFSASLDPAECSPARNDVGRRWLAVASFMARLFPFDLAVRCPGALADDRLGGGPRARGACRSLADPLAERTGTRTSGKRGWLAKRRPLLPRSHKCGEPAGGLAAE